MEISTLIALQTIVGDEN